VLSTSEAISNTLGVPSASDNEVKDYTKLKKKELIEAIKEVI